MSLSKQTLLDLMALADGELRGEAKARVEKLVEKDEEARHALASFAALGEVSEELEGDRRVPAIAGKIADSVMARIANEAVGTLDEIDEPKVVRLRRAGGAGAVSLVLAMAAGWWIFLRGEPASSVAELVSPSPTVSALNEPEVSGTTELESTTTPVSGVFFVTSGVKAQVSSVVVWLEAETEAD